MASKLEKRACKSPLRIVVRNCGTGNRETKATPNDQPYSSSKLSLEIHSSNHAFHSRRVDLAHLRESEHHFPTIMHAELGLQGVAFQVDGLEVLLVVELPSDLLKVFNHIVVGLRMVKSQEMA